MQAAVGGNYMRGSLNSCASPRSVHVQVSDGVVRPVGLPAWKVVISVRLRNTPLPRPVSGLVKVPLSSMNIKILLAFFVGYTLSNMTMV